MINARKALKGLTYKLCTADKRGRARTYSRSGVLKMDRCRKKLAKDKTLIREVVWEDLIEKSDVPDADPISYAYIRLLFSRARRCSTYVWQLLRTAWEVIVRVMHVPLKCRDLCRIGSSVMPAALWFLNVDQRLRACNR